MTYSGDGGPVLHERRPIRPTRPGPGPSVVNTHARDPLVPALEVETEARPVWRAAERRRGRLQTVSATMLNVPKMKKDAP
jgi:hypothetical protein